MAKITKALIGCWVLFTAVVCLLAIESCVSSTTAAVSEFAEAMRPAVKASLFGCEGVPECMAHREAAK